MSLENITLVTIFGRRYRIGSDSDSPAYIETAAAYLDEKMQSAAETVGRRAPLDVAILAVLEIAQEVLVERKKKEALLNEADEQISSFTRRLEDRAEGSVADPDHEDDETPRF